MNAPLLPGRIEHWPLARLRPYTRNAKTHDADQVAKIAASMAEFGWTVPCLVAADGELIAGHGRVLAAAQLGLTEAPVIVLGHLTEAQRRAYRIADNKLTELGGWDEALLLEELRGLMAEDFDLGLIGIPEDELDALLHDADDRAPIDDDAADAIPDAPAEPITQAGDIWELGAHRLICGDATDQAVVARLMGGAQSSLMFTSPPYAQQRDYGAAKGNFSNTRIALVDFRRRISAFQHSVMVYQLCRAVWTRWMDMAVLAGAIDLPGYATDRRAYLACDWLPTKWDWIDPAKDAAAEILQIEAGLKSRTQAIAERGYDAEQVDREIAAERKREAELGLDFRRPGSPAQAAGDGAAPGDAEGQQRDQQEEEDADNNGEDRDPRPAEDG